MNSREGRLWNSSCFSPKSSTLVFRLSFPQDTILPVFDINKCLLFRQLSETPHTDCSDLLLLLIIKVSVSALMGKERLIVPFRFELWSWKSIILTISGSVSALLYFTSTIFHRISKCVLNRRELVFY